MALLTDEHPLLLASGSPRRREILATLRVPFVVAAVATDESTRSGETPEAYLVRIVAAKLEAALGVAEGGVGGVLVADTTVIEGGGILGKPASPAEAEAMIARLAGKTHEVWTRFAIGGSPDASSSRPRTLHEETVVTRVTFRPLTAARIHAYAMSGEGADKAGAYAVQGLGSALVSRIEGSYTNVVGLPACEVAVALESLGLLP